MNLRQYLRRISMLILISFALFNSQTIANVDPDDYRMICSGDYFQMNDCCLCTSAQSKEYREEISGNRNNNTDSCDDNSSYAIKSKNYALQVITPISEPLVNPGDRFGSSMCISPKGDYVVSGTDPFISYTTSVSTNNLGSSSGNSNNINSATNVHLLDNLDYPSSSVNTYYLNIHHDIVREAVITHGHIVKCYDEYLLISDGKTQVQVFVRTQNPPWSLLVTWRSPEGYADSWFGRTMFYVNWTKHVLICDYIHMKLYVFSLYTLNSIPLQEIQLSEEYQEVDRYSGWNYRGDFVGCSPYVYLSIRPLEIHILKFDTDARSWRVQKIINAINESTLEVSLGFGITAGDVINRDNLGYSLSCTNEFLFASSPIYPYQTYDNEDYSSISVYKLVTEPGQISRINWKLIQILEEPPGTTVLNFNSPSFGFVIEAKKYSNSDVDRGTRLAISDPFKQITASSSGIVYLYEYSDINEEFVLCRVLVDKALSFRTNFGYSLGMSDSHMIIGSPGTSSSYGGDVYKYNLLKGKCIGCDDVINSCGTYDVCHVCKGNGTTCSGCDGIPFSGKTLDHCGVCNGKDNTCITTVPEIEGVSKMIDCNSLVTFRFYVIIPGFTSVQNINFALVSLEGEHTCGTVKLSKTQRATLDQIQTDYPSYQTNCDSSQCVYFSIDIDYVPIADCAGNQQLGYSESFSTLIQASKNGKSILFPVTLRMESIYSGCKGCDDRVKTSPADSTKWDVCLICGGDGSTCKDCSGVVFGDMVSDYCGECNTIDKANSTCISATLKSGYELLITQCKQTLQIYDYLDVQPYNVDRSLRWKLITKTSRCGTVSVKYTSGNFTLVPNGYQDCNDQLIMELSDTWKNSAKLTLNLNVYGCDIIGCDGIRGSGAILDRCGICAGINSCVDCMGVPYGPAKLDLCGICNGQNDTCNINAAVIENMLLQYEQMNVEGNGDPLENVTISVMIYVAGVFSFFSFVVITIIIVLLFSLKSRKKVSSRYSVPRAFINRY